MGNASHLACTVALLFVVAGCAKGVGGGGSTTRRDGGTRDTAVGEGGALDSGRLDSAVGDSAARDTGARDTGVRDTGHPDTGPACVDDDIPDDCMMATELGSLDVGGSLSATGKLPMLSDEDWYAVDVPSGFVDGDPTMQGAGMPHVTLTSGDATIVMEIRMRCGAALACGDSTARELLEWSFVDDQSDMGDGAYSTRDVPWPDRVYVKVSHRGGPASCEDYTLSFTR